MTLLCDLEKLPVLSGPVCPPLKREGGTFLHALLFLQNKNVFNNKKEDKMNGAILKEGGGVLSAQCAWNPVSWISLGFEHGSMFGSCED
jgi:hypothetical protein